MSYRQIYIKSAKKLSYKDDQLLITREEEQNKVPLEDINFIILEDYKTIITSKLLAQLSKYYISLIICDEKHDPVTITYSYNQHYKQLEVLELQLKLSDTLKEKLWKKVIEYKIQNQLAILFKYEYDPRIVSLLEEYLNDVNPGDSTNREGLAAKIYFRGIFGADFIRFYDDGINATLNYGYSILKSAIVRSLSAHGLLPYLGINHKSKTNNFNLAYDLIEPFRPIVDKYVYNNIEYLTIPLSFDTRKDLVNILNEKVKINNKMYTVQFAVDIVVQSYIKSIESNKDLLQLPILLFEDD